jgi:hypothetical protein
MRLAALAGAMTVIAAATAAGQTAASTQHPYGLDPYKPSDAALLREYGGTLVAQTPLLELSKLDPYKPSEAALLRQIGNGLSVWGWVWYPLAGPMTVAPPTAPLIVPTTPPPPAPPGAAESPAAEAAGPSSMATLRRPESNDGVWIRYAEQRWIVAGRTVPFLEGAFVRVGEYGEFPVFKRAGSSDSAIYLPARDGMLVPYRPKPPAE